MFTADTLVREGVKLASLPEVYWRVKRVVDDPDKTTHDLAKVVSVDPAVSAHLLRLVNSPFWGFKGQIGSVARAVTLLGMLHVHDVVLATSVADTFKGISSGNMNLARFWRGSVFRALAAASLARKAGLIDAQRPFVEGLLSDLGHMVLYHRCPELASRALRMSLGRPPDELARVERELIGCDYAQVGGALVGAWGLPAGFRAAIEYQDRPDEAADYALEAALIHIAGRLEAKTLGAAPGSSDIPVAASAWQLVELEESCIPEVTEEAATNLSTVAQLLHLETSVVH